MKQRELEQRKEKKHDEHLEYKGGEVDKIENGKSKTSQEYDNISEHALRLKKEENATND